MRSMNVLGVATGTSDFVETRMHMVSFRVGDIGDIGSGEAVSLLFSCGE